MVVNKLLKRFLKENGIYGTNETKNVLSFVDDYDEAIMPFNAFRWEVSSQGHNYWYSKALKWILYLYDNYENIDKEEKTNKTISVDIIKDACNELIKFYCPDGVEEETLLGIDGYKEIKELYNKLN